MNARVVILGPLPLEAMHLEDSLRSLGATVGPRLPHYPDEDELGRVLRAVGPDLVFLSTDDCARMESTIAHLTQMLKDPQIVLVDARANSETLRLAMRRGVRECLTVPIQKEDIRGAIERSLAHRSPFAEAPASRAFYSFFPVKPGVGATTLAVQTALALPLDREHRALLLDGDLDTGIIRFMLKLQNQNSLIDAMERVEELDEALWPQLVSPLNHLDVMQAGDSGSEYTVDLLRLQHVLAFARRQYSTILVDLPGAINRLSSEIMRESKAVYLVTTPEVASLHMARVRIRQLRDLLLGDNLRLLVNRAARKSPLTLEEIAETVGMPVEASFENNYPEVQHVVFRGERVSAGSLLGRQVASFAESLSHEHAAVEAPKKRRFLEVFSTAR